MYNLDRAALDRYITGNYGEDSVPKDIECSLAGEGAQWDAWVKQYPSKRWVVWNCPDCRTENVDSPDLTATPMCGDCGAEFDWWDFDCLEEEPIPTDEQMGEFFDGVAEEWWPEGGNYVR